LESLSDSDVKMAVGLLGVDGDTVSLAADIVAMNKINRVTGES